MAKIISDKRKDFIHHNNSIIVSTFREIVFGVEDGMVSTLCAITGIAIGSQSHYMVLLAGSVIIAVESISMGVGAYLSNLSDSEIKERKLYEEKFEINNFPEAEEKELMEIYLRDGWPKDLAIKMAKTASQNHDLMLLEMAYHELNLSPDPQENALHRGWFMFIAYIIGGLVPLFSYLILPINIAIYISIVITLVGLFGLGAATTKYTKKHWFKTGGRIFILGGVALLAGLVIGSLFDGV